jgi:hypothetical protein
MGKATSDKSNPIGPRIVIVGCPAEGADAALKGFIDDWFVPALIEEYIRLRRKPVTAAVRNADPDVKSED